MLKVVFGILSGFWAFLKLPLLALLAFFAFFGLFVGVFLYFDIRAGRRFKKGVHVRPKRVSFFRKFLFDLPRQYARDLIDRDPEFFRYQGCIVYTGRQGFGKTIAMVEQTRRWQLEYPKAQCITNLDYKYENDRLCEWQQLIDYKNGIRGVIVCMDEMQNWFSSNQSKNFPPEMLEVVTQNRKNRRVLQGTAQTFNRLSKPLREQASEVRRCMTFLGCVTFVHRVIPELDSNGEVKKWKHRGFYSFVHTPELRHSYDTWKVIESLRKSGFQERKPDIVVMGAGK